jgi:hypothetical protein
VFSAAEYKHPYHICVPTGRHLPGQSHGGLAAKDSTVPERPGGSGAELRPAFVPMRVPTDSIDTDYHGGSLSGTFGLVFTSVYDGQVENGHLGIHRAESKI